MQYWLVFVVGVVLDQWTKHWATETLSFFTAKPIVGPLTFQLVHNHGAAYGIFENQRLFLIAVSLLVLVLGYFFRKDILSSRFSQWGAVCIAIGTIGNLIDRVLLGYVVDFVNIQIIPVFNIADMAINCGAALFIAEYFFFKSDETR